MQLRSDDVKTADRADTLGKLYIGTPARHIRRHGNSSLLPRERNDLGLIFILSRIEQTVGQALHVE